MGCLTSVFLLPYIKLYKDGHNTREAELTGIGCCWLALESKFPMPGSISKCRIEVKQDLSDFVAKVNYYLRQDNEREAIAKRGLDYFHKYLSPEAGARIILSRLKENFNV